MRPKHFIITVIIVLIFVSTIVGSALWWLGRMRQQVLFNYSRDMLEQTADQIEQFFRDNGCYPTIAEYQQMAQLRYWSEEMIVDMWGRPFIYEPRECRDFVIRCLGRDGKPGGSGFDADMEIRAKAH